MISVSAQAPAIYLRPLNLRLRITASRPAILVDISQLLGQFRRDRLGSVTHEIELRNSRFAGQRPSLHILINGRLRYRSVPARELAPYLEWVVTDLIIRANQQQDRYCLLHAAIVVREAFGVLICGNTGCGKSSLSLALMLRHYQYVTDEIACWDVRQKKIIAYPRAIALKEQGYQWVRRAGIRLPTRKWRTAAFDGSVWYVNPAELSPGLIRKSAKIRLVIFPVYRPEQNAHLRPVSGGRAIRFLHRNRFDGNGFGRKDFEALTELVREAPAFRLVYDDVLEAAALIDTLVRKQGRV